MKNVVQLLENNVTVINIASKTFTDSNPRTVVHCLLWGGGGILALISLSPNNGGIYRQDDRGMSNDKIYYNISYQLDRCNRLWCPPG